MMRTRTALCSLILALTLAVAGTAPLAADNGALGAGLGLQDGAAGDSQRPNRAGLRILARYLELTPEQIEATQGLLTDLRDQSAPLRADLADLRQQLRDELGGGSPDPTSVGTTVIAIQDLRQQLRDGLQAYQDDFEALLTPEQELRYDAFRAARRFLERGLSRRNGNVGSGDPGLD